MFLEYIIRRIDIFLRFIYSYLAINFLKKKKNKNHKKIFIVNLLSFRFRRHFRIVRPIWRGSSIHQLHRGGF